MSEHDEIKLMLLADNAGLGKDFSDLVADAERYRWLKQWFSAMSVNIDGMHYWAFRCPSELFRGANVDEAADRGIAKTLTDRKSVSLKN